MVRPSLRMPGACPVTLRAASIGEAAFLFPSAPAPVERRRKPLIAGPARPKGGPPGRARYDEGSYGHRQQSVTGRRFIPSSFPRTTAANARWPTFPPGVIFSRSIPMRQDDRPFWQEVREELDPRKNVVGWQPPSSCSWSSVCLAASTITPPNRPCARPPSSASRGSVHVLQ